MLLHLGLESTQWIKREFLEKTIKRIDVFIRRSQEIQSQPISTNDECLEQRRTQGRNMEMLQSEV